MPSMIHASGLSLDRPILELHLDGVSDGLRTRIRDASLLALDRLVALACGHRVAALVLVGPLLHRPGKTWRGVKRLRDAAERLAAEGIELVLVPASREEHETLQVVSPWPAGTRRIGAASQVFSTVENSLHLSFASPQRGDHGPLVVQVVDREEEPLSEGIYRTLSGDGPVVIPPATPWDGRPPTPQGWGFPASPPVSHGGFLVTWEGGCVRGVQQVSTEAICMTSVAVSLGSVTTLEELVAHAKETHGATTREGVFYAVRLRLADKGGVRKLLRCEGAVNELLGLLRTGDEQTWWDHVHVLPVGLPSLENDAPPDLRGLVLDEISAATAQAHAAVGYVARSGGALSGAETDMRPVIVEAGSTLYEMLEQSP